MSVPIQIDHNEQGLDRLLQQFKDSPNLVGTLESFTEQINQLEVVLFEILTERGIFNAVGVQLDVLGALFGLPRRGQTDEKYRAEILRRIAGLNSDGTTEVFMQVLRTITDSDFVDFWEHDSGDVHALLGDGFTVDTYGFLQDLVAAGVNLRVYVDDEFDSFQGTELIRVTSDLQTNNGEDIQVTDGVTTYDLNVQRRDFGDFEDDSVSILREINDVIQTPYFAELLFSDVTTQSGNIVDEEGNLMIGNNGNNIIWLDYEF